VLVHDAGVDMRGLGGDPGVARAVADGIRAAGGEAVACSDNLQSREGCERVVAAALEAFGRLDVLVHNAGLVAFAGAEDTDEDVWERLVAVNVAAPFWLARAALPAMKRERYGRIILTVSGVAMSVESAMKDVTAYAVGKAAQYGLMNALAAEGAEHGIRVNAISPVAATRMYRGEAASGELEPEQVAPGVAFLASEQCDVSGVVLRAGGGRFMIGRYVLHEPLQDLGREPTPEAVAERWEEILGGP
jgi:NAD(P)-dependent dehydrogenase (short-subunit alcohol dehydrogenase family)